MDNLRCLGTDAIKPTRVLVTDGFEGPYLTNSGTHASDQAPAFHQRFESTFGTHHSIYTVEAYDAAHLLMEVLNEVGLERLERAKVIESLKSRSFDGLSGTVRFDDRGERQDAAIGIYRYDASEGLQYLKSSHELRSNRASRS